MLKALLRKQLLEIRAVYFTGRKKKDGSRSTVKNPTVLYILFGVLYLLIMFSFYGLSHLFGGVLDAGMDWLFLTIMSVMAFIFGIFGSVLSTASRLFIAKDNELLLSMPIPPSRIVLVRMISVYLMGFVYEAMVMVPAVIYYFVEGHATALGVIFSILGIFILGFLIAAFSCAAGWVVALIASKLKNQKIISVFLIVILIAALYYFRFEAESIFRNIAQNADRLAQAARGWAYPLYIPGYAMSGDVMAFLIFLVVTAVLFVLAFYAVSRSFSKIALTQAVQKQTEFRPEMIRTSGQSDALLRREMKRFLASISYMLNAGLGILFLLAGMIICLIKMGDIRAYALEIPFLTAGAERLVPVILAAAVGLLTSFCLMASCSVSMEGKNIWIYQSMPVEPYKIFRAKIDLHLILTGVPALLCTLAAGIAFRVEVAAFICMVVFVCMYIVVSAFLELQMDLKRPKLDWTNENQALKSNLVVLVDMLVAMLAPIAIGGLYLLVMPILGPELYLVIWIAIFAAVTLLVRRWLVGKGSQLFSQL